MLTIKAKIGIKGREIRRASVPTPESFEEFSKGLTELLDLASKPRFSQGVVFKYADDEDDLVSIYNDADLREALRQVAQSNKNILRVTVVPQRAAKKAHAKQQRSQAPRAHGHCGVDLSQIAGMLGGLGLGGQAGAFDMSQIFSLIGDPAALLSNPALAKMAEDFLHSDMVKVEQPFLCDQCDASIAGDRFHCNECKDFDLCSECHTAGTHGHDSTHTFKTVTALEALRACLCDPNASVQPVFAKGKATDKARHAAFCDGCQQGIFGVRHKCADCPDFDFCGTCVTTQVAKHANGKHLFVAIGDPKADYVAAVTRARDARDEAAAKAALEQAEAKAKAALAEAELMREEAEKRAKEATEKARVAAAKAQIVKVVKVEKVEEAKPEEAKPEAPKAKEATKLTTFERNLQTLASMGFLDRERNVRVLIQTKGKLFDAIQTLLRE